MSATVFTQRLVRESVADKALRSAGALWFLVAVTGQWLFVYFIVSFYYRPTLHGRFDAWNRKDLITGYVAGDRAGNLVFASHVLVAALITTSGAIQLIPQIRAHAITFHRWNGRFYILTALLMATMGLWLTWVRGTYLTVTGAISGTFLASLIIACAAQTLRYALARKIGTHRRWALRLFLVANGVWFQRIGYMSWIIFNKGPVGIGDHMDGPFDIFLGFAEFILPLTVLEIYLWAQSSASAPTKRAMATFLFVCTVVTGVGAFGTYTIMWEPYL